MMNSELNFKETLQKNNDDLQKQFTDGVDIVEILQSRSQLIDELLQTMWQKHQLDDLAQLSLIAVGGYGRREMHPSSDVDLLVLLEKESCEWSCFCPHRLDRGIRKHRLCKHPVQDYQQRRGLYTFLLIREPQLLFPKNTRKNYESYY